MPDYAPRPCAWSGDPVEFWSAISRVRANTDVESDQAVLLDVIQEAMQAARLRDLLVAAEIDARQLGSDLELSAGQAFAWADRLKEAINASQKAADDGTEMPDV